ncbi:MAG: AAA family ATPase [Desulfonatronovibrio sp.]
MSRQSDIIDKILETMNRALLDKPFEIRLALASFLAGGHLLIEDIPGVGKTTLALSMARVLGLDFARIQMTSDLLPGDVLGVSMFDPKINEFRFHPGPIFHSIVLADEINRASPRTQSALLEAMAEKQVSADGKTYPLPETFLVIATQNPMDEQGVNALPDSQMDRFLMSVTLGYPGPEAEKKLLTEGSLGTDFEPVVARDDAVSLRKFRESVFLSQEIVEMITALTRATREKADIRTGLSPRGMLALKAASQAWAMIEQRDYVIPQDLLNTAFSVINHRLAFVSEGNREYMVKKIIDETWG